MVVGIYSNKDRDEKLKFTDRAIKALSSVKAETVPVADGADLMKKHPDILLVLGGDGTILNIVSPAADCGIPILGVNLGNLGFLSEGDKEEIKEIAARLSKGNFEVERRSMLETKLFGKTHTALNEIAVMRANDLLAEKTDGTRQNSCVITVEAYVGGSLVDRYIGDGVIVSTPTGSTAYSLSAGGAVMSPRVSAIQIVSVCSHSLHTRPVVIEDTEEVTVRILSDRPPAAVLADGRVLGRAEKEITVKKHAKCAEFIKLGNTGFYERLLNKLNKWGTSKL